ncbi:MAG: hypothetical protein CMM58_12340 [Rhodospirillaceae bacterium]|nr:hypothetical protein [Rhodospirillaceae bacterium]
MVQLDLLKLNAKIVLSFNVALYLLLFISFNIWVSKLFVDDRIDLTADEIYTISPATLQVLSSIKEPIKLRLYATENLNNMGTDYLSLKQRVEELLEQYKRVSDGLVVIERINPKAFSPEEDLAVSDGIHAIPDVASGDQVILGLTGRNSTNGRYTIPHFSPERANFVEYDLTRMIYDLINTKKRTVAILGDLPINGDRTQQIPPWTIMDIIERFFSVVPIFGTIEKFSEDIDILLLIEPGDIDEVTLYAIDQFIMRGGRVLVFLDPFTEALSVGRENGPPIPRPTGLESMKRLLSAWGVEISERTIVGDLKGAAKVKMKKNNKIIATDYPVWFEVEKSNFASQDVVTSGLSLVNFRSAGYIRALNGSTSKLEPLIWASDHSGAIDLSKIEYAPDPTQILADFEVSNSQHVVMGRITGQFKSAFPEGVPASITNEKLKLQHKEHTNSQGVVLLVADADFLSDIAWVETKILAGKTLKVPFSNNGDLVISALEYLSGGGTMIGLRGKGISKRRFLMIEEMEQTAELKYRAFENDLLAQLEEREKLISTIQKTELKRGITYTNEHQIELENARADMLQLRKKLRDIQFSSRENISSLKETIIIINIWTIPISLVLVMFALVIMRMRRHG